MTLKILAALLMLAVDEDAVDFSKPIVLGNIQAQPALAMISRVPLIDVIGQVSQSKDECFILAIRLDNSSSTKRVDFGGWPGHAALRSNFSVMDEFGNRYKGINFGFAERVAGDESGETIEPRDKRTALVVFEKPVALAMELIIDLDGGAIGQDGKRLKWRIKREQWEKNNEEQRPEQKAQDQPQKPERIVRTWTSADGNFTVDAEFSGMTNGKVKLIRESDGKELTVELAKLSESDRSWIRDRRKK